MLMAKILQNLANLVPIFKEEAMKTYEPFLTENKDKMVHLFELFSTLPNKGPPDQWRSLFSEEDQWRSVAIVIGTIHKNKILVREGLPIDPRIVSQEMLVSCLEEWEKLLDLIQA
eukprot:TRINITY_DN5681_c0_g1_i1.p1 TRINITY_DN5681_c0_g1~~TRINITY_DN5681_c0_g1_i1.p1  ORF type:complete len:115 (-),score=43.57 TRINITY_DN5681_c0_g1_i1:45-389(-)